jgi:hypothetical protein
MADVGTIGAGHLAGRIQPTGWTAPDGSWVMLLGSEYPDVEEDVIIGDFVGFSQMVDFTNITSVNFGMKFRNTTSTAIGFEVRVLVSGAELLSVKIPAGETRDYTRRTINVHHLTGDRDLEVRLEAVAP